MASLYRELEKRVRDGEIPVREALDFVRGQFPELKMSESDPRTISLCKLSLEEITDLIGACIDKCDPDDVLQRRPC